VVVRGRIQHAPILKPGIFEHLFEQLAGIIGTAQLRIEDAVAAVLGNAYTDKIRCSDFTENFMQLEIFV
jgi:hypothetical protein